MTEIKFAEIERAGSAWTKDLGPVSVNKPTLNKIYKFARKFNVKTNPMIDVERMKSTTSPENFEEAAGSGAGADIGEESKSGDGTLRAIGADEVLSAVELAKLIETAQLGLEKVKIMLAIFKGLRHGELNGLRWSCVDLKRGRIFVNRSLTELKGGAILERPKTKAA
jgi:hypothetical protein